MADDGRMVDWQDPSEILMQKEEEALVMPFPTKGNMSYEQYIEAIGDMASREPLRWQIHRVRRAFPDYTIDTIATIFKVNRCTVIKYLKPFTLQIKDNWGSSEVACVKVSDRARGRAVMGSSQVRKCVSSKVKKGAR